MEISERIAILLKEVQLDGKWIVGTNIKEQISDLNWEEATHKIGDINTIASLVFHINYYISGLIQVLKGGPLAIKDKYSYDMAPIENEEDWNQLKDKFEADALEFSELISKMTDEQLFSPFIREDYADYFRNLIGMLEHAYYHFGQIVIIKKLIRAKS